VSEEWIKLHTCAVQWDPIRTAPNRMAGYRFKAKWKVGEEIEASEIAARVAWSRYGDRCFIVPVRLCLHVYRPGRRMDDCNIYGGLKWVQDQLFSALDFPGRGFTPTDGPTWVRQGPVEQTVGRDYEAALRARRIAGPTVVLTIEGNAVGKRPRLSKQQRERIETR